MRSYLRTPPEDIAAMEAAVTRCYAQSANGPPSRIDWETLRRAGDRLFGWYDTTGGNGHVEMVPAMKPSRTSKMALTIFLTIDAEKNHSYTKWFFESLWHWNRKGLPRTQIIAIVQRPRAPELLKLLAGLLFPVDVVWGRHEQVGDCPVWDFMDTLRRAWSLVQGEYVTFAHTEFLLCADRLQKIHEYLEEERPTIALGNLRRPINPDIKKRVVNRNASNGPSKRIVDLLKRKDRYLAAAEVEAVPSVAWLYQCDPASGQTCWIEDVFFAHRPWLEAIRFFEHANRLVFQDVYDLIGMADYYLCHYGLNPYVLRMPQSVHRAIHLHHVRHWKTWTDKMAHWFLSHPARWDETNFLRPELWRRLINYRDDMPHAATQISALRKGQGGTVSRFSQAFEDWLVAGEWPELAEYYRKEALCDRSA